MTVESATYVNQLDITLPSNTDFLHEGDNHITLIKKTLKNSFLTSNFQYPMDRMYQGIVPIGAIVMWNGTTGNIPWGWAHCNGQTVARTDGGGNITTPNLEGKFPLPANTVGVTGGSWEKTVDSAFAGGHIHTVGDTGGAGAHSHGGNTGYHAITLAEMPAHNHGGGSHTHSYLRSNDAENTQSGGGDTVKDNTEETAITGTSGTIITTQGSNSGHRHTIASDGTHTHGVPSTSGVGDHRHSVTVNITPPFYHLIFIMKH
jgi:hypothetical protein